MDLRKVAICQTRSERVPAVTMIEVGDGEIQNILIIIANFAFYRAACPFSNAEKLWVIDSQISRFKTWPNSMKDAFFEEYRISQFYCRSKQVAAAFGDLFDEFRTSE